MNHLKGASLLRKDSSRRLKYQELQRIKSNAIKALSNSPYVTVQQSEGQLKTFTSKLVK